MEAELDIEVDVDVESAAGGGLSDGSFEDCEGEVSLLGPVDGAGEEEFAWIDGCDSGEEGEAGLDHVILCTL